MPTNESLWDAAQRLVSTRTTITSPQLDVSMKGDDYRLIVTIPRDQTIDEPLRELVLAALDSGEGEWIEHLHQPHGFRIDIENREQLPYYRITIVSEGWLRRGLR